MTNTPPITPPQPSPIESAITALAAKVDALADDLSSLRHQSSGYNTPPPPLPPPRPHMKLKVPRFDGNDAVGWIYKITQFFDFHNTLENDRLAIASFYMDGPALSWFQWMTKNGLIHSWPDLLMALETRFAPSFYDDPRGALFKLTQNGSVNQYLNDFERIANRIVGLPHQFLLSCFVSGLALEIRREVQAFQPISIPHATALAKIQEDKQNDRRRSFRPRTNFTHFTNPTPTPIMSSSSSALPTTNPIPPPPQPPSTSTPKINFKQLSPEELISRRERNLCYNCDERFTPGHCCKGRFFLLISEEDDTTLPTELLTTASIEEITSPNDSDTDVPAQLSLHAMSGSTTHNTIRLSGTITNQPMAIPVDGGSTHNFIQTRLAKFLGLTPTPTPTQLRVMVGSGDTIKCTHKYTNIQLTIQGHSFFLDLFDIPLGGTELVLGAPWLQSVSPILMDYKKLSLSFTHLGQPITLTYAAPFKPNDSSYPQVKRSVQTNALSSLFQLQIIPSPSTTLEPPHTNPTIDTLLQKFDTLFNHTPSLPPTRPTDHQIHLIPNTTPVNVRPYRYPYFQKCEIEKQVSSMLSSGLIQPSRSPFSSPVLLVKKKDGSWRCCVDYRALNAITIKDRFPLPTIDELLDDLGKASWFSKLDLQQGFHQIRMTPNDIPKTAFRTHHGHYEYKVMPFGLCNAPSTFQSTMNKLFQPFLRKFAAVFFMTYLFSATPYKNTSPTYNSSSPNSLKHNSS